jgi:hypothetical protein
MRVDGVLDTPEELEFLKDRGVYSIEVQYRLRNNLEDFHQLVLRPMLGYKIDDSRTLWLGYTYVAQDVNGEMVSENRLFQMITYSGKINKTPILFMGATRIEERLLEDKNELAIRLRQLIRISYDVFQINQSTKLGLFFQDEVFIRMNQSWAGQAGYDQNRAIVGLELKTKIKDIGMKASIMFLNTLEDIANDLDIPCVGAAVFVLEGPQSHDSASPPQPCHPGFREAKDRDLQLSRLTPPHGPAARARLPATRRGRSRSCTSRRKPG